MQNVQTWFVDLTRARDEIEGDAISVRFAGGDIVMLAQTKWTRPLPRMLMGRLGRKAKQADSGFPIRIAVPGPNFGTLALA
jgi:ABC-type uncharacterized transport system auxiliary subunit